MSITLYTEDPVTVLEYDDLSCPVQTSKILFPFIALLLLFQVFFYYRRFVELKSKKPPLKR